MSTRTLSPALRLNQKSIERWAWALLPLALMALLLVLFLRSAQGSAGGGDLIVQRVMLPEPDRMVIEVVNPAPEPVTIAQVMIDDAYWDYQIEPGNEIPRMGSASITLPYPWVETETHLVVLVTTDGALIETEVSDAAETPAVTAADVANFVLIGLYIGLIPIGLGLAWHRFARDLKRPVQDALLALAIGLLVFLLINTASEGLALAGRLPGPLQGIILLVAGALVAYWLIQLVASRNGTRKSLNTARSMAISIGARNVAAGLAVGAAFASGAAGLGMFLVVGFALFNILEGNLIAASFAKTQPALNTLVQLAAIAGLPAVLGVVIGGLNGSDVLATVFLGAGAGAMVQAIVKAGRLLLQHGQRTTKATAPWVNAAGFAAGLAIMYFTALLVM